MGPPGSCRPQMGPMLAPWTLLSGQCCVDNESVKHQAGAFLICADRPKSSWWLQMSWKLRRQVISKSSWWLLMTWRLNTWHIWYCITCKVCPIKQHVLMCVAWLWVLNGFFVIRLPTFHSVVLRALKPLYDVFGGNEAICKNISKIDLYLSIRYTSKHERCLYLSGCTILSNARSDSSQTVINLFHNCMLIYAVYMSVPTLKNCAFIKSLIFSNIYCHENHGPV